MDTRNENRPTRDSFNFNRPMASNLNASYGEQFNNHTPNYDRSLFQQSYVNQTVELPPRKMMNDRFFETTQIYRNFSQNNDNVSYQESLKNTTPIFKQTRKDVVPRSSNNLDRIFMNNNNFDNEIYERINGFNLQARDTRFESTKKSELAGVELRANRYMGMPSNDL